MKRIVYRCGMCGGSLPVREGMTVCQCEFCGSTQAVPNLDDEKKEQLFSRAVDRRLNCEFSVASGLYEGIVVDYPEEAEGYWGLILCKYGVQYVEDPRTGNMVPTFHRTRFHRVMDDPDFERVLKYSDISSKEVYLQKAEEIERLREEIIEVTNKEKPYDIFICYKEKNAIGERTEDSVIAEDVYNVLVKDNYRVFFARITLEDKLGQEFEPYIYAALDSAKVMLVFGTEPDHYNARWVKNEWSRFLSQIADGRRKTLIACYKGIDINDMPAEFKRLMSQDMGKIGAVQDLVRGVEKIIPRKPIAFKPAQIQNLNQEALLKRGFLALEEGEFKSANRFFEQVLNINAECGQAYWGKTLSSFYSQNIEQFADAIWKKVYSAGQPETIEWDIVAIAREEDRDIGIIPEISDEELKSLLKDLIKEGKNKSESLAEFFAKVLRNLESGVKGDYIQCSDYTRALRFEDSVAKGVPLYLKNYIIKAVTRESEKEAKQILQTKNALVLEIHNRILAAVRDTAAIKEDFEIERAAAEVKAEEEYQKALNERDNSYKKALEKWEEDCNDYNKKYESYLNQRNNLQIQIKQKENELNELDGGASTVFKRLRIMYYIEVLKASFENTKLPSSPGAKPVKAPLSDKVVKKSYHDYLSEKGELYFTLIRCALSPEVKKKREEEQAILKQLNKLANSFGGYPQGKAKEYLPLKWRILDVDIQKNKALLITESLIEHKKLHKLTWKDFDDRSPEVKSWRFSSLQKWLNHEFVDKAFNIVEKDIILTSYLAPENNPDYSSHPGEATKDRVFLLSIKEAEKYFESDTDRQAKLTPYADSGGYYADYYNGYGSWWLRTVGRYSGDIAIVDKNGKIDTAGSGMGARYAVRPALWVDLKKLMKLHLS